MDETERRSVSSPGEAGLPQTQHAAGPAWPLRGHPEAVQFRGAAPGAGAPEAAQPSVPRQSADQPPRVQVMFRLQRPTLRLNSNVPIITLKDLIAMNELVKKTIHVN